MSLIQQFEPMPDFKAELEESVILECKGRRHELWMAEQSDIRRKQIKWMGDKMVEFSSALKTEWELGTHLRNKVHEIGEDVNRLRNEIINKEMTMLKKETLGEKAKTYALIIGLILSMITLYDLFKNQSNGKPPTKHTP